MSDSLLTILEMIEEVLEESPSNEQLEAVKNEIVKITKASSPNLKLDPKSSKTVNLVNTGSRKERITLIKDIVNNFDQSLLKNFTLKEYFGTKSDGSADYRVQIFSNLTNKLVFNFVFQKTPGSSFNATKFEISLVNAINKNQPNYKPQPGSVAAYQPLADDVIANMTGPTEVLNQKFMKLGSAGIELTDFYKDIGASKREPKTDIISQDGKVRISVKKSTAQFISSEGPETEAVVMSVLKSKNSPAAKKLSELIRTYFSYTHEIASSKGKPKKEREAINRKREFFVKRFKHFLGSTFKRMLVREAMVGDNKFVSEQAKPNYVLVWSEDGTGKIFEIEKFITAYLPKIKFGVRGRGGTRGLSLRGET